ncbi:hypothetical protein PUN28_011004 [Cardiocondyla obscurior]|uniref:Uncharacterized protein n=1 Tax=Cardiocondyla obscurior TaxID=286306 RepID=A0AAW2FPH2_9HYME
MCSIIRKRKKREFANPQKICVALFRNHRHPLSRQSSAAGGGGLRKCWDKGCQKIVRANRSASSKSVSGLVGAGVGGVFTGETCSDVSRLKIRGAAREIPQNVSHPDSISQSPDQRIINSRYKLLFFFYFSFLSFKMYSCQSIKIASRRYMMIIRDCVKVLPRRIYYFQSSLMCAIFI